MNVSFVFRIHCSRFLTLNYIRDLHAYQIKIIILFSKIENEYRWEIRTVLSIHTVHIFTYIQILYSWNEFATRLMWCPRLRKNLVKKQTPAKINIIWSLSHSITLNWCSMRNNTVSLNWNLFLQDPVMSSKVWQNQILEKKVSNEVWRHTTKKKFIFCSGKIIVIGIFSSKIPL